jgi:tRNA-dihydrouridine synthase B
MIYAGEPDFGQIAEAKNAVRIPVIANGGIFSREDAEKMLAQTGADGVMIARAALYNPHIFCELTGTQGEDMKTLFLRQLDL